MKEIAERIKYLREMNKKKPYSSADMAKTKTFSLIKVRNKNNSTIPATSRTTHPNPSELPKSYNPNS
jgi:hypothetical protein